MPFRAGLVRPWRAPGSDLTSPTGISAGGRLAGGRRRRTAPRPHTPRAALKLPSATRGLVPVSAGFLLGGNHNGVKVLVRKPSVRLWHQTVGARASGLTAG